MDGVAFFDSEKPDEGVGDGFASLFAAVFDLGLEFSAEGFDVFSGRWVHGGGFGGFDDPCYPSLAGVLIVNTDLQIPSGWPRRRIEAERYPRPTIKQR